MHHVVLVATSGNWSLARSIALVFLVLKYFSVVSPSTQLGQLKLPPAPSHLVEPAGEAAQELTDIHGTECLQLIFAKEHD